MNARRRFLGLLGALCFPSPGIAQSVREALPFSVLQPGAPLPDWLKPFAFSNQPRRTEFSLVADEGRTVLHARAEASASGLARELRIDPREHPLLAWRWKVANLIVKSDLARKEGDDFAARLYLTFDFDPATLAFGERMKLAIARAIWGEGLSLAALCYVWDSRLPVGTIAPNAYTDRVRMVVADSGAAGLGRWVSRERNVVEDYRRAFGTEPPVINGVIVSVDTDNTGETAESWFGDVTFRALPPS